MELAYSSQQESSVAGDPGQCIAPRPYHHADHRSGVAAGQDHPGEDGRGPVKPTRKLALAAVIVFAIIVAVAAGFWARPLSYFNGMTYVQMKLGGAKSRYLTVSGRRIHYYVMGPEAGSPVVLVHGLGGRSEDWRNLAPYLVRTGFRVYMPD